VAALSQCRVNVTIRQRNRWATRTLLRLLAWVAPLLSPEMTRRIGNRILQLYAIYIRIGEGPWQRVEHGIAIKTVRFAR
jgi:hypothetical protein